MMRAALILLLFIGRAVADVPLSIRYNNPGALKSRSLSEAKSWWGAGVLSVRNGYVVFTAAQHGMRALYQQIDLDAGRGLTLKAFIVKYVDQDADPTGTANALKVIPQILGVPVETPLQDINRIDIAKAIVQNEGGITARAHYFKKSKDQWLNDNP